MDSVPAKTSIRDRLRRPGAIAAIVVTLLPLLYFFPATRGHLIISPDDGIIQNIPFRVAVAEQIRAGYRSAVESGRFLRDAAFGRGPGRRSLSAELVLPHLPCANGDEPDDALDLHGRGPRRLSLCATERLERGRCRPNEFDLAGERFSGGANRAHQHHPDRGGIALVVLGAGELWPNGRPAPRRAPGRDRRASGFRRSSADVRLFAHRRRRLCNRDVGASMVRAPISGRCF